jgi:type IV pilus biogenesis/stability protein PilW
MDKAMAKYIFPTLLATVCMSLLSGCVTQSFENNEPIVKTQANRDEMAATRVSLGLGYLGMGDMSQAKLNLEKAKRFSPNLVQVHTAFAHYYETVGEATLAVESFEQALLLKADSADTLNNYGVFLCRQGNVDAAEVQLLKAIAVPSYLLVAQSYENLASCYLQNDNFEKAEMYLNKAIYHSPNRTATLLQMVRLQYAMANYTEGKRFLQKFERNTLRFTSDSLALAYKLYWKLGQRRTASNYANMLVKMYPQSWEAKQYLLNELELIDADNLAKKYKLTQRDKNKYSSSSSNKRVVKLSPKKSSNSLSTNSANNASSAVTVVKKAEATDTIPAAGVAVSSVPQVTATGSEVILSGGSVLLPSIVAGTTEAKSTKSAIENVAVTNVKSSNTMVDNTITAPTSVAQVTEEKASITQAVVVQVAEDQAAVVQVAEEQTAVAQAAEDQAAVVQVAEEQTAVVQAAIVQVADAEIELTSAVVEKENSFDVNEPTSTQPIAAKRDVPLPEALPEPIEPEIVKPEVITPETVVAENTDAVEKNDVQEALHTILAGENLYSISMKYNVKLSALRKWNNISEKNKIRIGKKLYVVDPQTVNKIND